MLFLQKNFFLKRVFATSLALCLTSFSPQYAFAQQNQNQTKPASGTRKSLATIVFCGLGGAILGLSTLSFYGRPQDHMNNIGIGFAVGVISGTVYVTVRAAKNPSELYSPDPDKRAENMSPTFVQSASATSLSNSYTSRSNIEDRQFNSGKVPLFNTTFEF